MKIESAKELTVYRRAFDLSMRLFELTKRFPPEERFALVSQIRRSSRSVCLNLREAWAKRRYEAHFVSKLTDSDAENSETDSSIDFALACGYVQPNEHAELTSQVAEIGRMLGAMIAHPQQFLLRSKSASIGREPQSRPVGASDF